MEKKTRSGGRAGLLAVLMAASAVFSGCASFEPKVFDYTSTSLHLKIIKADSTRINQECRAEYLDNGYVANNTNKFLGCWKPDKREIWVDWNRPEVLVHELCHVSGKLERDCAAIQWE